MTAIDPYRTLGLAPGASQAEIKRAYRQLAKLYHPDSAGERAVARFLVIQAAYEALVDEPGRPRPGRGGAAARPSGPPPPPWQADAARARATRDAYRARNRRAASGATDGGPAGGAGAGPTRPPSADPAGPRRPSSGNPAPGGRSTRRRKATIGSTSYDGVEAEPFSPPWEGATWYGAGSGTYWTLNPKEYADPRKHGPEYLARSRRAGVSARAGEPAGDGIDGTDPAPDPAGPGGRGEGPAAAAGGWAAGSAGASSRASATTPAAGSATSSAGSATSSAAGPSAGGEDSSADRAASPDRAKPPGAAGGEPGPSPWTARARPAAWAAPAGPARSTAPPRSAAPPRPPTGAGGAAASSLDAARGATPAGLTRFASTSAGRIGLAILGWIPLGVGLAAASEAVPACDGVATVCSDPLRAGIWPVHLLIIGLLALVPRLGVIAAVGSVAFLGLGLVATPVLLAVGGAQTREGTAAALTVVLVVAWLAGIALALSGRVDLPPWRGRRVR